MGWVVNATLRQLYLRERDGTHCLEGWISLRACLENLTPTGIQSPDRPACSESPYRLHYPGTPRHGTLVWYLSHPTQYVLHKWNISCSIFVLPWLPLTVVMWLHENVWRSSQRTKLISCELKLATRTWVQTGNSSLCEGVSHSVPSGTLYLRHQEAAETATFWKPPACVPQRDLLYQNALLYLLRSLCFHFSSLPLPRALPSVP